jgi:hypothetical protein
MPEQTKRHVRYPNHYAWLLVVASLDIFMTYVILQLGGYEANPLADHVIARYGVPGMVIFKLCLITLAIVIAEEVGRRDERKGRKFVEYAIVICAFPVIFGMTLLVLRA